MGTNHGRLVGAPVSLLLQQPGPPSAAAILLVGDGYRSGELELFRQQCQRLVEAIKAEPWYRNNAASLRLNVYRQDVVSDQAGPSVCGATANTYFNSTFGGPQCRVITVNNTTVNGVRSGAASDLTLPPQYFNVVGVLVNSVLPGGQAQPLGSPNTSAVVASVARNHIGYFLHELAHTFGPDDEYEFLYSCNDANTTGYGPTVYPNVDGDKASSTVAGVWPKWPVTTSKLPTRTSSDCSRCEVRSWYSPLIPYFFRVMGLGPVGAYEGAGRYHCGLFRPTRFCRMRNVNDRFCPVCEAAIVSWLS